MTTFLNRLAARRLGRRSHINRPTAHNRILATTRRLREEMGLAEDRRLAR